MDNSDYITDPNEAAFARPESHQSRSQIGLTKREYFAAQAMVGLLSQDHGEYYAATTAVRAADFLIEKLNEIKED